MLLIHYLQDNPTQHVISNDSVKNTWIKKAIIWITDGPKFKLENNHHETGKSLSVLIFLNKMLNKNQAKRIFTESL